MNRIYRSIWNAKTGTFVAASENAKSQGKKSSPSETREEGVGRFALIGLAVTVMLAYGSNSYALPTGGAVAAGSANIAGSPGKVTINQSTQNVAINWQTFNIGKTEAVQFVQPNSSSVALNRVLGTDPSSIMGSLSANGKVFLVNPNGILFGKGAQVNVGALVASTRNITDSDFMAGNYKFAGTGNGTILNQGSINADGGYVALLGATVSNEGVISARLGTVALAAGNAYTLDVAGDGLLNVMVNKGAVNALVQNGGMIRADGGQVVLTAQAAGNLLQGAVNNTGVIQAQTVENRNGTIRLLGDMQTGTVSVGGTLDASGAGAGQTGGSVTVTGHHVGLFGGHINASGDAGGGTVLVGGGYQGKNPALQNASATYMSADSSISADAITQGNGGTVVVWANDSTRAYGSITARAGAQSGDGGLIETSGHWLDVVGIKINASAPNGKNGVWLLDPADVTIGAGTTDGAFNAGVFEPNSGVGAATVDAGALRAALEAGTGTDITITTTNSGAPGSGAGNITVASALTWVAGVSATLTLNAAGDVNINADVSITRGNLVVCCGQDVNVRAAITTDAGSVSLSAGRDVNIVRSLANIGTAITVTNGNILLCAGRNVILNNALNPGLAPIITLTNGSTTAGLDLANLGVPLGLTLRAGNAATGPGPAGGTVVFTDGGLAGTFITVTAGGPGTPVSIFYNPINYSTPTPYSLNFTGTGGPVTSFMLVFPDGASKVFDGTTTAIFTGLKSTAISGIPAGVTLVAGPGSTAAFDTADVGLDKIVTFNGFTLAQGAPVPGDAAINFALPAACCGPTVGTTTGNIIPAPVVVAPGVVPPVVVVAPADAVPQANAVSQSNASVIPLELAALSLSVLDGGVRMPPIQFAAAPPVATEEAASEVPSPVAAGAAPSEVKAPVQALPLPSSPVVAMPAKPTTKVAPKTPIRRDRN